ncbi:MAG: hypothetical protein AAF283_00825 [Cyanobacteria bacterium P01_A01_bin.70]
MFKQLSNLAYQRTAIEAVGFYIAYLLLCILLGAIGGGIAGIFAEDPFQAGLIIGSIVSVVFCAALALAVAMQKSVLSDFFAWILIVLAVLLAILIGGIGGLLPISILSTRPSKSNPK